MRKIARLAAVIATLWLSSRAHAADEVLYDHWYAHYHKDVKAGWDHTKVTRSENEGRVVWITESESQLLRFMDGSLLKTPWASSSRYVEDEAGAVIEYRTSVNVGLPGDPQTHEGKVKDGIVSAVDQGKAHSVHYPKDALGPAAIHRAMTN